jgi:hypothetical protein
VVKLTFGTPTSVTRTGFVKVTVNDVFTPEKGYGFQSTEGLLEYDRGGSEIARPKDEYTASVYGAYRTTSDLTCALVEGTSDNAFVVALPDGEYTVWLIAGDAECDPPGLRPSGPVARRCSRCGPTGRRNSTCGSRVGHSFSWNPSRPARRTDDWGSN